MTLKNSFWSVMKIVGFILISVLFIKSSPILFFRQTVFGISWFYYLGAFLIINDWLRHILTPNSRSFFVGSLLVSIVGAVILIGCNGYYIFYYLMLLDDVIRGTSQFRNGFRFMLLLIHTMLYIAVILPLYFPDAVSWGYPGLLTTAHTIKPLFLEAFFWFHPGIYLLFCLLYYQVAQKVKYQALYQKTQDVRNQDHDSNAENVQLAVSTERNRIAQEMHDSIGHLLTALIMHLDFLEKVQDSQNSKLNDLILKCQNLARSTLTEVRKAIYALQEKNRSTNFTDAVREIINNFSFHSNIEINYIYQGNVESLKPDLKHILYKTIQEAVTNSIKHGAAEEININLKITKTRVKLIIQDNGIGAADFVKHRGLNGIEQRLSSIGGTIRYFTEPNCGFKIVLSIIFY